MKGFRFNIGRVAARVFVALSALLLCSWAVSAHAAPNAKIIRIDPRPVVDGSSLTMTMVVDLGEPRSPSKALEACGAPSKEQGYLSCAGDALQDANAFYAPIPWPPHAKDTAAADPGMESEHVAMTVRVNGGDRPAELVSRERWGKLIKTDARVGTSFLILIDASNTMKGREEQAKEVARQLIAKRGKNDLFNIKWFNDSTWFSGSGWTNDVAKLNAAIDAVTRATAAPGRSRPLFDLIKSSAIEGFSELGNTTQKPDSPLHHSLVVLSDGWAGTDFGGSPPALATQLGRLFADGLLDENNASAPRTPVPIISVWFPAAGIEEAYENANQFMRNLAVPSVGGAFYMVSGGAEARGAVIANNTRKRFDAMHVLEWKVPCLEPSATQSFKLLFAPEEGKKPILGDGWNDVPFGVDPREWPLDVNKDGTARAGDRRPAEPGKTTAIFGNFCWGNQFERAEVYLIPKGDKAPEGGQGEEARKARNELTARGLRATPIRSGNNYVEVRLPDTSEFIGEEKARLVVVDGATGRSSSAKEAAMVTIKAQETPMALRPIFEIVLALLVLGLLVGILLSGGGRKARTSSGARPAPVVAGGGDRLSTASSVPSAPVVSTPSPSSPLPSGGNPAATVMFSATPPAGGVTGARLRGPKGVFQITQGREFRVGRDPGTCDFPLQDPRVSAAHCRLKIEAGRLMVLDEASQAGTFINGSRVAPGNWQPVHHGAILRCATVDLMIELE